MKTLPVAVQVYSVREDAEKDFAGTMKKIKEIGYDGVELAGLYGLTPQEVKAAIEDAGLVALSAHVPFQDLVADMEGTIQQYVEIGVKYIAIPYLMEEDRPGTPKFEGNVKLFEEIGKACKAHGIQTLYHNHDFEFAKMPDGRYALDYIYDTIPADPPGPPEGLPQGGQARQYVQAHRHRREGRGEPWRVRVPSRGPRRPGLRPHSGGFHRRRFPVGGGGAGRVQRPSPYGGHHPQP